MRNLTDFLSYTPYQFYRQTRQDWFRAIGKLPLEVINSSGTPSASTFLRGDGVWAPVAGGGGGTITSVNGYTGPTITLDKSDIGLSNVDNTSDANKPVSTAVQSALNSKAALTHTHPQSDITNLVSDLAGKQGTLVSGTSIKTVDGVPILGSGNLTTSNIYNTDGTIGSNRIINTAGNSLSVSGTGGSYVFNSLSQDKLSIADTTNDWSNVTLTNSGRAAKFGLSPSVDDYAHISTTTNTPLVFRTNSVERMRLDTAGLLKVTGVLGDNNQTVDLLIGNGSLFLDSWDIQKSSVVFGDAPIVAWRKWAPSTSNSITVGDRIALTATFGSGIQRSVADNYTVTYPASAELAAATVKAEFQNDEYPGTTITGWVSNFASYVQYAGYRGMVIPNFIDYVGGAGYQNAAGQTITNRYGLYIAAKTAQVTNQWGVYQAGASDINNFNGKTSFGKLTTPTAKIDISGGTSAASSAPIKIGSGTAMTTPEDGAIEYHSSHLYFTIGSTRYQLDQQSGGGSLVDSTTINTSTTLPTPSVSIYLVLVDATNGDLVVTLPSPASASNKIVHIKKVDSTTNKVTFTSIEGVVDITKQWDSLQLMSNGTSWYIL